MHGRWTCCPHTTGRTLPFHLNWYTHAGTFVCYIRYCPWCHCSWRNHDVHAQISSMPLRFLAWAEASAIIDTSSNDNNNNVTPGGALACVKETGVERVVGFPLPCTPPATAVILCGGLAISTLLLRCRAVGARVPCAVCGRQLCPGNTLRGRVGRCSRPERLPR
jgi:hypothetical protein